jgi:hypothetical protein
MLTSLTERFAQQGHQVPALLRAIVLSDAFSTVREKEEQSAAATAP